MTTSILPFKVVDCNFIHSKLNLKENNNRKTNGASDSMEEPAQTKDDFDWLKNLEDEEEVLAPPQKETQPPPQPSRSIWNTLDHLTARMDHMTLRMYEMRRDQEEMKRD